MRLSSLSFIKSLLKKHVVRPNKRLGQNFLISKSVLQKIINAAALTKKDTVLEVGPGVGTLTLEIAKRAKEVIAIEKDSALAGVVRDVVDDLSVRNVKVVQGDILKLAISSQLLVASKNYKVVANIPYYITSPVIRMFLEAENKPELMILLVQKEVAQRICSKPPRMSILSVAVQFYAKPEIVSYVSKKSFWPRPKVDSAILRILDIRRPSLDSDLFFKIVRAGFSSKRKFLINNLSRVLKKDKEDIKELLNRAKIDQKSRAENLSVEDWVNIYKHY